jgi:hypothetical protein
MTEGVGMSETFDEIPKVKTRAVRRRDGIWDLYIDCPYCGKEHHHGGGDGNGPNLGYRLSHCGPDAPYHKSLQEYELV